MARNSAPGAIGSVAAAGYTDIPSDIDRLGMNDVFYSGISRFIETCETPMTIAIQGDWGSGKTSAMRLICKELESDSRVTCVEVNTWQLATLNQDEHLPLSLLREIFTCILEATEGVARNEARKTFGEYLYGGVSVVLDTVSNTGSFVESMGAQAVKSVIDSFAGVTPTDATNAAVDAKELKAKVEEHVAKAIASSGPGGRVVIFVDDLDRLAPAVAISALEVLKNFLDCAGCVYVLAVDREVVNEGVRAKYGDSISREKQAKFFDKIIQVPFSLPVGQYNVESFVRALLTANHLMSAAELDEWLSSYVVAVRGILRSNNPRTIKRAFNTWSLYQEIHTRGDEKDPALWRVLLFATLLLKVRDREDTQKNGGVNSETDVYDGLLRAAREGKSDLRAYLEAHLTDEGGVLGEYARVVSGHADDYGINVERDVTDETLDQLTLILHHVEGIFSNDSADMRVESPVAMSLVRRLRSYGLGEQMVSRERIDYVRNGLTVCSVRIKSADEGDGINLVFRSSSGARMQRAAGRADIAAINRRLAGAGTLSLLHSTGKSIATLTGLTKTSPKAVVSEARGLISALFEVLLEQ